jgi:hypothetical protein
VADKDRKDTLEFQRQTARLQRAVMGSVQVAREQRQRLDLIKRALMLTPAADQKLVDQVRDLDNRLRDIQVALSGDPVVARYNEPTPPSIVERVQNVVGGWSATGAATSTQRDGYRMAADAFAPVLEKLRTIVETDIKGLDERLEAIGAPYTPGRVPKWNK